MSTFVSTYFAWAAPNILPAIASAAVTAWIIGWLRGQGPIPASALNIAMPVGLAAIIVLALSAGAALLNIQTSPISGSFGIVAGAFAGVLLAPRHA